MRSYFDSLCVNRALALALALAHLLAAGDGAAAEVSAGFGVDHSGNVFLRHQVSEELLTALRLLPEEQTHRTHVVKDLNLYFNNRECFPACTAP